VCVCVRVCVCVNIGSRYLETSQQTVNAGLLLGRPGMFPSVSDAGDRESDAGSQHRARQPANGSPVYDISRRHPTTVTFGFSFVGRIFQSTRSRPSGPWGSTVGESLGLLEQNHHHYSSNRLQTGLICKMTYGVLN